MIKRVSSNDPSTKALYSLKKSTLRLLQFISGQGAFFPYTSTKLQEHTALSRSNVATAIKEVTPLIDRFEILLKEEHRKTISMCLMHVKMVENIGDHLGEIEEFLCEIPNISEIYRARCTERDYILKINYKYQGDLDEIRDMIANHHLVRHIYGTNSIIRPVNTPHSELAFLFSNGEN